MHRSLVFLSAAIVALVVGVAAWAIVPDGGGVIHACYKVDKDGEVKGNSDLRIIDPASSDKNAKACKKDEVALDFNQTGPQGEPGEQGPQGDPGVLGFYKVQANQVMTAGLNRLEAFCNAGDIAVGGGYGGWWEQQPIYVSHASTRPQSGPQTSYLVMLVNDSGQTLTMFAWVNCADMTP